MTMFTLMPAKTGGAQREGGGGMGDGFSVSVTLSQRLIRALTGPSEAASTYVSSPNSLMEFQCAKTRERRTLTSHCTNQASSFVCYIEHVDKREH